VLLLSVLSDDGGGGGNADATETAKVQGEAVVRAWKKTETKETFKFAAKFAS
jgi:hypothetical protein